MSLFGPSYNREFSLLRKLVKHYADCMTLGQLRELSDHCRKVVERKQANKVPPEAGTIVHLMPDEELPPT